MKKIICLIVGLLVLAALLCWVYWTEPLDPEQTVALFTVLLALLTGLYVMTTFGQLRHMRLVERAWLGCGTPALDPLVVGNRVKCVAAFHNSGRTPARIISTNCAPLIIPRVDDLHFSPDMAQMSVAPIISVVPPDGFINVEDDRSVILTQEELDRINDRTWQLWIYARVYYRDILENKLRWTNLYFVWEPETQQLYGHNIGNEMT